MHLIRREFLAAVLLGWYGRRAYSQTQSGDGAIVITHLTGEMPGLGPYARAYAPVLPRKLGNRVIFEGSSSPILPTGRFLRERPPDESLLHVGPTLIIHAEMARVYGGHESGLEAFAPIALLAAEPLVVLVAPSGRWKTIAALVEDARADRDVSYGCDRRHELPHVATEAFLQAAGASAPHLSWATPDISMWAVARGRSSFCLTPLPAAERYLGAGALWPLAVTSARRVSSLPEVPTLVEAGYPLTLAKWLGLFASAEASPTALARFRDAVDQTVSDEEFLLRLGGWKQYLDYRPASEFARYLAEQRQLFARTVDRIGKI